MEQKEGSRVPATRQVMLPQVSHQRGPGVAWKVSPGGFGRGGKALQLEAQKDFDAGEAVTMDFGPQKLDAEILLNYGQMDDFVTRVSMLPFEKVTAISARLLLAALALPYL